MTEISVTLTLTELPDYGSLHTREAFGRYVETGSFIDYDGYGYLATEEGYLRLGRVSPSRWEDIDRMAPEELTHVFWFNR